jgi:DNA-binding NarL/FixJ family response regulator
MHRQVISEAVMSMLRARGPLRSENHEGALKDWRALLAGRWSLVDHFDSDGRRFVVARRNAPPAARVRGLSEDQVRVARLAALGHPIKLIAYELGRSPRTIQNNLAIAMAKLGAGSRVELARLLSGGQG